MTRDDLELFIGALMTREQPLAALRTASLELVRSGLTVRDLADLLRAHPRAVAAMLDTKALELRADN